ncbi:FAD-dependent oxidoreductase [Streptomyces cellulosae]|uniref:Assimilatory nitrate reductase electron transfer subunit n=1 Tax=Streptomyces thermodiastaticus TaxID=44061 RepID=A0ABU0KE52_9ACTN|nr:NAD(P)/FAD-dependent oxidoreductase [Streptomyces sp. McG8]MDQ0487655.1 assimilatory nitrate reductase electron transfer subunit [Streptomyces thermodiastaticus]UVT09651.1 NAD(P)/FAD-dependent oxidoreductase [Streptomyces thermocarboxydus]WSB41326.1 FAD-dependent oxidoreductase [Streptomyces cellulosae]WTB90924.1 FAD-dependent oxidoreductase [Streptomyces cellulosae]
MTSNERVVVIGSGLAGVRLARRLGELGTPVTLIGEEEHPPYNRVLLAEVLAGRYRPEVIALPAPAELIRARVTGIDRDRRTVVRADGTEIPYGRLVLATGSNPVLPPLRGLFTEDHELPRGVHAFRTLDDCLGLSAEVRPGVRAVVIGGGLLGVSAARALAVRGAQVVLAQQSERLMERQLDPAASGLVKRHLTELGVEVHTECRVRDVRCVGGAVRSVEMADGYALDADLVVLACGVHPRVSLAQAAGLDVAKGVVVDDELRTSDPYVHAIGDCVQHAGTVYGLAAPALEQADALAALLAGDTTARYTGTRSLTRLTLTGPDSPFDLAAFGETEVLPGDDVVQLADATRGTYRKVVVRDDRLVGGVLVGELGTVGALARAWEGAEPLPSDGGPLLHLLTNDGGS